MGNFSVVFLNLTGLFEAGGESHVAAAHLHRQCVRGAEEQATWDLTLLELPTVSLLVGTKKCQQNYRTLKMEKKDITCQIML